MRIDSSSSSYRDASCQVISGFQALSQTGIFVIIKKIFTIIHFVV